MWKGSPGTSPVSEKHPEGACLSSTTTVDRRIAQLTSLAVPEQRKGKHEALAQAGYYRGRPHRAIYLIDTTGAAEETNRWRFVKVGIKSSETCALQCRVGSLDKHSTTKELLVFLFQERPSWGQGQDSVHEERRPTTE